MSAVLGVLVGGPQNNERLMVPTYMPTIEVAWGARPVLCEGPASSMEVSYERGRYLLWESYRSMGAAFYVWEEDAALLRDAMRRSPARPRSDGRWRYCRKCDVKWWGDPECWNCNQPVEGTPFHY